MIRFKDKIFDEYFIDKETAVITDVNGIVQKTYIVHGRLMFKKMKVHCIQAHTAWGYKEGFEVHHIDENKMNNALSNLAYLTKAEHSRLHMLNGKCTMFGKHQTDSARAKISVARKGTHLSEDTIAKISDACKGNKNHLGKHHSAETKAKISAASKGCHWWNNGVKSLTSFECPRGRMDTRQKRIR